MLWSVGFFIALDWGTAEADERGIYIALAAITYAVGFTVAGYLLGKPDDQSKVRYNLKDAYAAVSNITSAIMGSIWLVFFKPQDAWTLGIYLPIIVLVGWIGYLNYKKSVKGMDNKELFQ